MPPSSASSPSSSSDLLFRPHDEAPACAARRPRAGEPGAETFELISRGDVVIGRLDRPAEAPAAGAPLVVAVHDTGASAASLDALAEWTTAGFAIARPDLALHGTRRSAKLSERLVDGYRALLGGDALDLDTRALLQEFARQSVSDLVRTLEAITALDGIDGDRVALVGLGVGAAAVCWTTPFAAGLRACVLGGEIAPLPGEPLDPAARLGDGAAPLATPFLVLDPGPDAALLDALPTRGSRTRGKADAATTPFLGAPDVLSFLSAELG